MSTRQQEERRIFCAFSLAACLRVKKGGVQKVEQQSKPDILCEIIGEGRVWFELVEILSEREARQDAETARVPAMAVDHYQAMPAEERRAFKRQYGDTDIAFGIPAQVSKTHIRKLVPEAFSLLKRQGERFEGRVEVPVKGSSGFYIRVKRMNLGSLHGPQFSGEFARNTRPRVEERIQAKLLKKYNVTCPIELIAYWSVHTSFPPELWADGLSRLVSKSLPASQFRRVWVFDYRKRQVLWQSTTGDNVPSQLAPERKRG